MEKEKHCGKRKKYWFPAFSPFPTVISIAFLRVVKSWDCVGKFFNNGSIKYILSNNQLNYDVECHLTCRELKDGEKWTDVSRYLSRMRLAPFS